MTDPVTIYALERVLYHLSEEQQEKQPRYKAGKHYIARADARVIIKRVLFRVKQSNFVLWEAAKES